MDGFGLRPRQAGMLAKLRARDPHTVKLVICLVVLIFSRATDEALYYRMANTYANCECSIAGAFRQPSSRAGSVAFCFMSIWRLYFILHFSVGPKTLSFFRFQKVTAIRNRSQQ